MLSSADSRFSSMNMPSNQTDGNGNTNKNCDNGYKLRHKFHSCNGAAQVLLTLDSQSASVLRDDLIELITPH